MKTKVYIKGPPYYEMTASTFKDAGKYEIVTSISEADICVWTGGEDINPVLYGEKPLSCTSFTRRDLSDLISVKEAVSLNKFLVGICRGAQLLNVIPNGGRLWQDVDGHGGNLHRAFDCVSGSWVLLNSVHHQMLRLTDKAEMICWAAESTYRHADPDKWLRRNMRPDSVVLEKDKDPEAVFYPETKSLLVQFHPEFGHGPTTDYFFKLLDKYYHGID